MKLPLSAMERILRKAGAERVSKRAKLALAKVIEKEGVEIGKKAVRFALHSGRKTVTEEDIQLAIKPSKQKNI